LNKYRCDQCRLVCEEREVIKVLVDSVTDNCEVSCIYDRLIENNTWDGILSKDLANIVLYNRITDVVSLDPKLVLGVIHMQYDRHVHRGQGQCITVLLTPLRGDRIG
jgi:hypothetical protein